MIEEWRDVPGYEGIYQISIDTPEGRCRSLNWKNTGKIKELSNKPNGTGYIFWHLQNKPKETFQQAARWIALTYPELVQNEYFEGAHIDHIDGNKTNNHPSNLRWVTRIGNMANPVTKKRMSSSAVGKHINRKDESKPVIQLNLKNEFIQYFPSIHHAERKTGVSFKHISDVCLGKRMTTGGFIWKYVKQQTRGKEYPTGPTNRIYV